MRIIAGEYKGRRIAAPEGLDVRPTSDKVRGAIFNALLSRMDIRGVRALDVFCGSGALGLEALSRGAAHCVFADSSKTSLDFARKNAAALGAAARCEFIFSDVLKLKNNAGEPARLAFLDPPYRKNFVVPALARLRDGGWLAPGAVCVAETEKNYAGGWSAEFQLLDEKIYGETSVAFLSLSL